MPRKETEIYESMTRVDTPHGILRVWVGESRFAVLYSATAQEVNEIYMEFLRSVLSGDRPFRPEELVEAVCDRVRRVTAVEWVNVEGNGVVVYTEWP